MHELFPRLLAALQDELQEFGALLHLFDRQQACVVRHDPAGFLDLHPLVEAQVGTLTRCRCEREALVREVAIAHGRAEDSTLAAIVADCPASRQPMLRALIEEINSLTTRVRRRMRQNCDLLAKCVDWSRDRVGTVSPDAVPQIYSDRGEVTRGISMDLVRSTHA